MKYGSRDVLHTLAAEIEALACVEREAYTPETGDCSSPEQERCHVKSRIVARKSKSSAMGKIL